MNEDPLHVVFGTGQVGLALTARLAEMGLAVRAVSRRRPATLTDGVDWRAADVTDPEAATDAAKGASVVYQCLNAPYTKWPELFPPLQRNVLTAAEHSGAQVVTLENVYGYGPTAGKPMTENLPLTATTSKGRTRAAMTEELLAAADAGRVRIAIGRASDFFGAGVTESSLGARVLGNAVAGKRVAFIGNPDLLHTYSYVPTSRLVLPPWAPTSGPSVRYGTCRDPKPSPPGHSSTWSRPRSTIPSPSVTSPDSRCGPWDGSAR